MYARIVKLHLLTSFLFLMVGYLMSSIFGDGAGDFLLIFIVALINFPGVKTVGLLFNSELSATTFYVLSIFSTNVYLRLLFYFVLRLRVSIKNKIK